MILDEELRDAVAANRMVTPRRGPWDWVNAEDLRPGDTFVARGRVSVVDGPPDLLSGVGLVVVPVEDVLIPEREFVVGRRVPTWRADG